MVGRRDTREDAGGRVRGDAECRTRVRAAHDGRGACGDAERRAGEVARAAAELERTGRLGLTRDFIQHGDVTVYAHVLSVAQASLAAADVLMHAGVRVDRASLLRGALLHDYFLYDWHDPDPSHRLHGFRHPFFALARAEEDFDLTPRERNIIVRHMFPLVPIPPTCREAWIVCLADKWCALRETVAGRLPGHGGAEVGSCAAACGDVAWDVDGAMIPAGSSADNPASEADGAVRAVRAGNNGGKRQGRRS